VLDETDSGLDIDALKAVSDGINSVADERVGVLLITHYQRILNYVKPDFIHVLINGKIVRSGGPELGPELERTGYDSFKE
jgi:Fe-S cluster assembly ATP-binding protein